MESEKLLSLFKHYMINSFEATAHVLYNTPLECQVVSVIPNLVITDGYHKVSCVMTREAMVNMKEHYPTIKIRDFERHIITLLKYCPHSILENDLQFILHVYDFLLRPLESEKPADIKEKIIELEDYPNMKHELSFETIKHMRKSLLNNQSIDKVPPLESILLEKSYVISGIFNVIKFTEKKSKKDETGKITYSMNDLMNIEDKLTEEGGMQLLKKKEEKIKEKEFMRKFFRERKQKPRSLEKDLVKWANDWKLKKEKAKAERDPGLIKEGVAKFIAKINSTNNDPKTISRSSSFKTIASKRNAVEKKALNQTELEYDAKGFKNFLNWRASTNNHNSDSNNVNDILKKNNPEGITISLAVPPKPIKAFDGWISAVGKNKDGNNSCKKFINEKPKL